MRDSVEDQGMGLGGMSGGVRAVNSHPCMLRLEA